MEMSTRPEGSAGFFVRLRRLMTGNRRLRLTGSQNSYGTFGDSLGDGLDNEFEVERGSIGYFFNRTDHHGRHGKVRNFSFYRLFDHF